MKVIDLDPAAPPQPLPVPKPVPERSTGSDTISVMSDVVMELERQVAKWGEQNHPDFYMQHDLHTGKPVGPLPLPQRFTYYGIPTDEDAKKDCDNAAGRGRLNWGHILVEEISESFGTTNDADLEMELIQSAAVIVNWVRCIRRRREQNG
jgi:hypothetical protein